MERNNLIVIPGLSSLVTPIAVVSELSTGVGGEIADDMLATYE